MKIISVVGARPNFMKIAPLCRAFAALGGRVEHVLVHTGQHYDAAMSQVFFDELELPTPNRYLGIGSGSHAEQTARVMVEFEKVLLEEKPDLVIVVGDVNSTIACAIDAAKLLIPVAHVEAGLRSYDREMPEEINRVVTDVLASYLFVTEQSGLENLHNEGVHEDRIFFVGNTMIDTLLHLLPKARASKILDALQLEPQSYCAVTLHRPSNVDTREGLAAIIGMFETLAKEIVIVFPMHPRTRKMITTFGLEARVAAIGNLKIVDPLGYLDFVCLMDTARFVLTDSGGIQEETTALGVPCITMRDNTERPVTVELGTNILAGSHTPAVLNACMTLLTGDKKASRVPPLWDGHAAERIAAIIVAKAEA